MQKFDAIIIGTGQSGPPLARRLVAAGHKVAVIERKFFGGTCVNTGCTPTKTLIASAYAAHLARRASDYGVGIAGAIQVNMKAVKARKDAVVGVSRHAVEHSLKTLDGCTVYETVVSADPKASRWATSNSQRSTSSSMSAAGP
jgi:pyruvate/2-oxoglutarate dehydrogenase complex dihydrolipoamide dehydrogenase (E3) component